jgi:hypothetical protein
MDAATAQIVVPAISSAVVAAITAIGTIWAAKINSRAKAAAAPPAPPPPPAIEIETLTTSVVIPIDAGFEDALRGAVPVITRSILAVRLLRGAPGA